MLDQFSHRYSLVLFSRWILRLNAAKQLVKYLAIRCFKSNREYLVTRFRRPFKVPQCHKIWVGSNEDNITSIPNPTYADGWNTCCHPDNESRNVLDLKHCTSFALWLQLCLCFLGNFAFRTYSGCLRLSIN